MSDEQPNNETQEINNQTQIKIKPKISRKKKQRSEHK
jgi:hypothetical protein